VKANGPAFTISDEVKGSVYRIVQEAAFNVVKHAGASRMEISVDASSGCLRVCVEDDGHGFPSDSSPVDQAGHLGLISMVERAEAIGGQLHISSSENGTRVFLEVPISTG
jgi:signal transduction histidine kinase